MPTYSYRCRECSEEFDVQRPMSDSSAPAVCPQGHNETVKLLTTVAVGAGDSTSGPVSAPAPTAAPSGGCCGGGQCG